MDRLSEFGHAFHVTTRKYMDGTPSSILWNTINLMPDEEWGDFLIRVVEKLDEGLSLQDACTDSVELGTSTSNILFDGFSLLGDAEWQALENGIRYCNAWPSKTKS